MLQSAFETMPCAHVRADPSKVVSEAIPNPGGNGTREGIKTALDQFTGTSSHRKISLEYADTIKQSTI